MLRHAGGGGISVGNTPGVLTRNDRGSCVHAAAQRCSANRGGGCLHAVRELDDVVADAADRAGCAPQHDRHHRHGGASATRWRGAPRGFEMSVLYADAAPNGAAERDFGAARVDLDTLLERADFVTVHTPLLPETRHLIGAPQFARMKRTAIFINSARGPIVDQQALAEALRSGTIAGAGIDVYEVEPLPLDDPLLSAPNVVLLPHIASASVATSHEDGGACGTQPCGGPRRQTAAEPGRLGGASL